jgi:hypothetical protein
MKRIPLFIIAFLLMTGVAWSIPPSPPSSGIATASNCDVAAYYAVGKLCQDTDDGKLYKGTGAAVVEIASGASGDVTAASVAQTWGNATDPVVWTFGVTGTDPTLTATASTFTFGANLALGANNITSTGSLGATGAGKLTKIWSIDAEFTNYPSVNGASVFNQDVTSDANPSFGTLNLVSTNSLNLGTTGSAVGQVTFKNATSGTIAIQPITGALGTSTLVLGTTYTDAKWCSYATTTGLTCTQDTPAGSGDVTDVGDCTAGACLDGSADGGTYLRLYDGTSAYTGITAGVRTITMAPSNANAENLIVTFGDNTNVVALSSGTGGVVNISGSASTATTAGNVSGTPDLPNGTTATTQASATKNTTIATTAYVDTPTTQTFTIADSADANHGTGTLTPTANVTRLSVALTCSDAHGCTVTMAETGAVAGAMVTITNISANHADFANQAGILTLATSPFDLLTGESLTLVYANSQWYEVNRAVTNIRSITIGGFTASKYIASDGSGNLVIDPGNLSLATTGTISGKAPMISKTSAYTLGTDSAQEAYGYVVWLTGDGTVLTLPAVTAGMSVCVYSADTYDKVIDPNASDGIRNGTTTRNADGHSITSGATAEASFACLVADSADGWTVLGKAGTWTDE